MFAGYTICYLGSTFIKIIGAYCVDWVHKIYLDSIIIIRAYCVGWYTICYHGSLIIIGAYCVGWVHTKLL